MQSRKVMILCASPRPGGNTRALAEWVAEGARSAGGAVEKIDLTKLRYAAYGCTSCYGCQNAAEYRCVLKDEASDLLARIPSADVLVVATPVYFFGPSAQAKVLLDRAYSLFKFNLATGTVDTAFKGTSFALIASGGGDLGDGLKIVEETFRKLASLAGGGFSSLLVPNAPHEAGGPWRDPGLMKRAVDFGRALASRP